MSLVGPGALAPKQPCLTEDHVIALLSALESDATISTLILDSASCIAIPRADSSRTLHHHEERILVAHLKFFVGFQLGDKTAVALARVLERNLSLTEINVSRASCIAVLIRGDLSSSSQATVSAMRELLRCLQRSRRTRSSAPFTSNVRPSLLFELDSHLHRQLHRQLGSNSACTDVDTPRDA